MESDKEVIEYADSVMDYLSTLSDEELFDAIQGIDKETIDESLKVAVALLRLNEMVNSITD